MKKQIGKRVGSSTTKPPAARKTARKTASAASSKDILTAGIQALGTVHGEAVARQSRVFESLLGIGGTRDVSPSRESEPTTNPLKDSLGTVLDPFGFRKFEDVFDQRVARALQHLALPTAAAFAELQAEVLRLRARVAVLEAHGRKR